MPLAIRYVSHLEEVVAPAVEFLERDRDLFAQPRIVVPTAGAKAWLWSERARRVGQSGGPAARGDGIVAHVELAYPGTILSLLQPPRSREPDPWSFDRLTFAALHVITQPDADQLGIPFDVHREPLAAARRIAGLFDEYQVRRPGMILEWERPGENRVLAPTANDEQRDGIPVPALLRDADQWQFDLWRAVRRHIDANSPPARRSVAHLSRRDPILVAGLQSLSLPQLDCLQELGTACEVDVLLVHPSPGLHNAWSKIGQQPLEPKLRGRPVQRRLEPELLDGVDQLLPVWLAGARDLQELLTAQGVEVAAHAAETTRPAHTLLTRMQRTIAEGREAATHDHDLASDRSLVIHRCHSLSRQAEVLHDALLQAFVEIDGLEPHEVAIVSPCIEQAAPHLEAVFARTITIKDAAGHERTISLPLVVADRGIREVSAGVELLEALLALPGSRCSVDDVLGVAGHPLVRPRFGVDDDTVATWADFAERTAIRWGLDAGHRARHGLTLDAAPDVHTWKLGLERMLLGATLPDALARPELGGVVPLAGLDPADIAPITKLVRILDVVRTLDAATADPRPVAAWCDAIEQALADLCGAECGDLAEPLAQLRRLRLAAYNTAAAEQPVPFADVRGLLGDWFAEKSGRQRLHTGAITATSMVPVRGVPFRVMCVIGYDDGAVGVSEADGDDLVARQQLVGDVDPRADQRRSLLDCLLAPRDRLVITCNGRSVKTNEPLPLVTPLAELTDFAVRHGVRREKHDKPCGIEIEHPRHHLSPDNFTADRVQPGGAWSHDPVALEIANVIGTDSVADAAGTGSQPRPAITPPAAGEPLLELTVLEKLVRDPLLLFLEETLGIDTWRSSADVTPATLPLVLRKKQVRELTLERLAVALADPAGIDPWREAVRASGRLPFGPLGEWQLAEIEQLAAGILTKAQRSDVPLVGAESHEVRLAVGREQVIGHLTGLHEATRQIVTVRAGKGGKDEYDRPLHMAALRLVVARAAGLAIDEVQVVARHNDWTPGATTKAGRPVEPCQIRRVVLGPDVDPLARLADWCRLAREALSGRRGLFGLDGVDPQKRAEAFESFIADRHPETGESLYPGTTEAIAYGLTPVFAEVFREDTPERAFLDGYSRLFRLTSSSTTYTLT
ncbi:MAG: exodeoxyribonuclease V subunit gamma [Planctomycetaceae bacterium]